MPFYLVVDRQNNAVYSLAYDPKKWMVASGRTSCVYLAQNIKTGEFVIAKAYFKTPKKLESPVAKEEGPIFADNIRVLSKPQLINS